jgi:methyl-accepting chemotaxis protein
MTINKYYYKNWSLFVKVFSLALLILLPVLLIFWLEVFPLVEDKILEEKKKNVKNTVEVAYGIVDYYNSLYKAGELPLEQAQQDAEDAVNKLRYEGNEYFWINDYNLIMIMHPIKAGMDNTSIADIKDPDGKYIFREMVDLAKTRGEGFVSYRWDRPGSDVPIPKISFIKSYDDWGWVIGSGIYVEDVEEAINEFIWKIGMLLIVVIGFALAAGLVVARTISKPIIK